jgi:hypothetical protein
LEKIQLVLVAAVSFVYRQGCVALFTIISQGERRLLEFFGGRGFLGHRTLPFYILRGRSSTLPADEFSTLNFLDADLAYRFEQNGVSDENL